jgi:hypothetical protein
MPKKEASGPREKITSKSGSYFARRDDKGQFTEMTDVGRSLAADRRQHAKTKKPKAQGDKGD